MGHFIDSKELDEILERDKELKEIQTKVHNTEKLDWVARIAKLKNEAEEFY